MREDESKEDTEKTGRKNKDGEEEVCRDTLINKEEKVKMDKR